jgi:hypothetical protein
MEYSYEKRVHRRWVNSKPVYFDRHFTETGEVGPSSVEFMGQGVDISQGGIGLTTQLPLSDRDILRILLPMAELTVNLPIRAEVVWTKRTGIETKCGLRFLV